MAFNPLGERGIPLDKQLRNWSELSSEPYVRRTVHPYTQCRVIVLNAIEVEAASFSHQFSRHIGDLDLRRQLATVRRIEQQQQKAIDWLIPGDLSAFEVTIGHAQAAVDLTAWVARNDPDPYARRCYEFALLEDFDHLYRFANLMDLLEGQKAAEIVRDLTEIMPGRPAFFAHRHPFDDVRRALPHRGGDPLSKLHALTITAAAQQTMNAYTSIGNRFVEPVARGLYLEIAQLKEQHVTQYGSMQDPEASWAEMLVLHEYNECYLYYSFMTDEVDPRIRQLWELHLNMELEHLHLACEVMRRLDGREPEEALPQALPEPIRFIENREYIRDVIASQVNLTADGIDFVPIERLPDDHRYFTYQDSVHDQVPVPSDAVIKEHADRADSDYRAHSNGPPLRETV